MFLLLLFIFPLITSLELKDRPLDTAYCTEPGERFRGMTDYMYLCKADLTAEIVACLTHSGKEVNIGQNYTDGLVQYSCVKESDGVRMHMNFLPLLPLKTTPTTIKTFPPNTPISCNYDGKGYRLTEIFTTQSGRFILQCGLNGISVLKCVTDDKRELEVGEVLSINNETHSCSRNGNTVRYDKT